METVAEKNDVTPTPKTSPIARIALGLLFLVPSLCCCMSQLLAPTLGTFWMSLQSIRSFKSEWHFVGLENYTRLFGDRNFQSAIGFTLTILIVQLLVVAVTPLALGWAASKFGRPLRLGLRILLTLPIAFFAPATIAITWGMVLSPSVGLMPRGTSLLAGPNTSTMLLLIDALYLIGLTGGLGLIAYLPIWRRPAGAPAPTRKEITKPALAIWGVGLLGIIALSLSTFSFNFMLTGAQFGTSTFGTLLYRFAFLYAQFGAAASIGTLILLATFPLGIVATLLILLARLRLGLVSDPPPASKTDGENPPAQRKTFPGIIPIALLLLMLVGCFLSTLPFGWLIPHAFGPRGIGPLLDEIFRRPILVNTFIPPLITASIQILIAYLGALSLGALQPFGKRSEWLLLLFSPWLFVTILPLSPGWFTALQKMGLLNTSLVLVSPILFSIPVLFILTIFFKGRASQLEQTSAETDPLPKSNFFKHFVLPSLPLAATLWLFLLLFAGQDLFWALLVGHRLTIQPLSIFLLQLRGIASVSWDTLAAAVTFLVLPVCFLLFVILSPFQIFYLDRLTLFSEGHSGDAVEDTKEDEQMSQE